MTRSEPIERVPEKEIADIKKQAEQSRKKNMIVAPEMKLEARVFVFLGMFLLIEE